jgi:hypothetical protein
MLYASLSNLKPIWSEPVSDMDKATVALARLKECYLTRGASCLEPSRPIVGFTSNTVPTELLSAAGMTPLLIRSRSPSTRSADLYMESVFSSSIRALFDDLISGRFDFLHSVVIPRTSEQEHKLYLYLREIQRQSPERHLPALILYNLLHTRDENARQYSWERTKELLCQFPPCTNDALGEAILAGNAARHAVRLLLDLRDRGAPSSQILPLIGAYYFIGHSEYARLVADAAVAMTDMPIVDGPRVLIKGCPLEHTHLHGLIESLGLAVAGEDDWWGSRAAGKDVATDIDPVEAIFAKYYLDTWSPRVYPPDEADRWFVEKSRTVNGVIFYLPPEDDVLGWDYPRQAAVLNAEGIPHVLLREDVRFAPSAEAMESLAAFATLLRN